MYRLIIISVIVFTASCATSTVTAYRDPTYATKSFDSIAVFAQGMELDAAAKVELQVCKKMQPTRCVSGKSILPPTRKYSAKEAENYLTKSGVGGLLFITLTGDFTDIRHAGSTTNTSSFVNANTTGNANFYQNSAHWQSNTTGTLSSQSTTTQLYSSSRSARGQLGLFDSTSGAVIWKGEFKISGRGAIGTAKNSFINSANTKIV